VKLLQISKAQISNMVDDNDLSKSQQRELNDILKKCMTFMCDDLVKGTADTGNHCSKPLITEEAALKLVKGDRSRIYKTTPIHMILANNETVSVTDHAINLTLRVRSLETDDEELIGSSFYIHNSGVDILFNLETLIMCCGTMFINVLKEAKRQGFIYIKKCQNSNDGVVDEVKFRKNALSFIPISVDEYEDYSSDDQEEDQIDAPGLVPLPSYITINRNVFFKDMYDGERYYDTRTINDHQVSNF
jgi:hypothetical protein